MFDYWMLVFLICFVECNVKNTNEATVAIKKEPVESPPEKSVFIPDISSSRNMFVVLHRHAIVVKEIMTFKYLQEMKGFCTNMYLPIQIKYVSLQQQTIVTMVYMESRGTELHDEQKTTSVCRKIKT
jgi:hypothetical protein